MDAAHTHQVISTFAWTEPGTNFKSHPNNSNTGLTPLTPDSIPSPMFLDGLDPYAENPAKRINNLAPYRFYGGSTPERARMGQTFFGHNSLGTTDFSEHFTTQDSSMIQGVYLVAAKGHNNTELPITIRVYKGGYRPGAILGKAILNPYYLDYVGGNFTEKTKSYFSKRENYIRFDAPISVGTDFYVGYEISYPIINEGRYVQRLCCH